MSWSQFCQTAPRFSIALDGYVAAGPRFDADGPRACFNHHEEVDRLATRATCAQILMAIRQGLFDRFRNKRGPKATVFVNDCDEDVCLAVFLLRNPHLVEQVMNPRLNRLVSVEELLDTTAGAYPFPRDLPALQDLAWVFKPYRDFRIKGMIERKDASAFTEIIDQVGERIMRYIIGTNGHTPLDTRYERIGGGDGWAMIREIGAQGRTGAFADGIHAYLSVRNRPDGRYTYTIGRMSLFVDFDIPAICKELNRLEGTTKSADRWGGASNIIGSPRVAGSKLKPKIVAAVIEKFKRR